MIYISWEIDVRHKLVNNFIVWPRLMGPEPSPGFFNPDNLFCHMSNTFTFFIQPRCLRLLCVPGRVVSDQVLVNQPDLIKNGYINKGFYSE